MSKFKVGDRVVCIWDREVITLLTESYPKLWRVYEKYNYYPDHCLVHEHIYFSPLYQALT